MNECMCCYSKEATRQWNDKGFVCEECYQEKQRATETLGEQSE